MPMTPQQLIDMPSYGMAEKQLRKDGRWALTDNERSAKAISIAMREMQSALEAASYAIRDADNAIDDALHEYRNFAKEVTK